MSAETLALLASPWSWAVLAVVLAGAELLAPGIFLIWLGAAAAATAALTGIFGLPWEAQAMVFGGFAVLSVLLGRNFMPDRDDGPAEAPVNRRGEQMIGRSVTVVEAIENGRGRVQIGDSPWRAEGPDLPEGARVRIVAIEGNIVRVEAGA